MSGNSEITLFIFFKNGPLASIQFLITFFKERFLMQKSNGSSEDKTVYQWWVPLTYTTNFKTIGSTWLAENEKSKVYPLEVDLTNNQWIIFNVDETGKTRTL